MAVLEAGWAVEEEAAADAAAAEDAGKRSAINAKATDTWHATAPPQTGATKLVSSEADCLWCILSLSGIKPICRCTLVSLEDFIHSFVGWLVRRICRI